MGYTRDALLFAFCWLCFVTYVRGPWVIMRGEFGYLILPYAGMYAYSESWADFRDCVQWNADGRPNRG